MRTRDGQWLEPDAPDDALVVNVGEMLELWSGGEFVATPHRVVNRSNRDRYSFPYFLVPNHDIVVQPLRAGPVPAHLAGKVMDVGALSTEVWRTNWPDEVPTSGHDLGTLDVATPDRHSPRMTP